MTTESGEFSDDEESFKGARPIKLPQVKFVKQRKITTNQKEKMSWSKLKTFRGNLIVKCQSSPPRILF